ncbi:hypothetical protein ACJX0J_038459, partial [Zea mays]
DNLGGLICVYHLALTPLNITLPLAFVDQGMREPNYFFLILFSSMVDAHTQREVIQPSIIMTFQYSALSAGSIDLDHYPGLHDFSCEL